MFGIGLSELIAIGVVIILLVNPKDLPRISRKAGALYASCIRQWNGFKRSIKEFEKEIEYYEKLEKNIDYPPIREDKEEK